MNMQRRSMAVVVRFLAGTSLGLAVVSGAAFGQGSAPAPAAAASAGGAAVDLKAALPADPRLVTGTLPNGLSYVVVKHSNPPGRANMYIHVSSGSLNETDAQRGLAHYLEHLAFNGSKNFPPGTVVDFFQSMGLTFGQHQNAFTSFDQTTYILSFPDTKAETMERGMKFFSDVAFGMLLLDAEIEEERQVIMEEKRTRLSAQQRVQEYVLQRLMPGSLIGDRLPIGTEQTIMGVKRPDFMDYYSRWYVPSNMTVIVVADAEPATVVEQISKSFSGGEKTPRPEDVDPGVKPYTESRAIVASDPELTRGEVAIVSVGGKQDPVQTVADFRREAVRDIAVQAFNRRIDAKLAKGGMAMTNGFAMAMNLFNSAHMRQVGASGEPGKWKDMLAELGTELKRARLHGFTQREIDDVKNELRAGAEQYLEQEKTIPAPALIRTINNSVATGDVFMSAQQELDLYKSILPTVSREEVVAAFNELFGNEHVTFLAQLPTGVEGGVPSESDLLALGKKALDVKPEAESEAARASSLMEKAPTPGKVVETTVHEGAGVTSAWLDNGVRVHHRSMDIRKDNVWIQINLAAGQIQETGSVARGTTDVAGLAWGTPATSTLSSTEIRDLMTGKKVEVGGGIGTDTMSIVVSGSPADLEAGLQQAHLMLTDPKIEPSAMERWKTSVLQSIAARASTPQAAFAEALTSTLFPPSEARTQLLTAEQVNALKIEPAQAWLTSTVRSAPMEVSVVGDITLERAMQLVTTYIGSLPKRERIGASTLDDLRTIAKRPGPIETRKQIDTQTAQAVVASGFYGPDAENVADTRTMMMASRVLSTRILKKIREKEQLVYSAGARLQPGDAYPGYGVMMMAAPTEPAKVDRLIASTAEIWKEFAEGGPTSEEIDVAKKQLANQLDETMKQPDFWLARLGTLGYRNVKLDDVMAANAFYQSLTPEAVKTVFAKYYKPEAVVTAVVMPKTPSAGDAVKPANGPAAQPTKSAN